MRSLDFNFALIHSQLPDAIDICHCLIEIFQHSSNRYDKNTTRIFDVIIPKPEANRENLEQIKWIEHFIYKQSRDAFAWHDKLALTISLLNISPISLVDSITVFLMNVSMRVFYVKDDRIELLIYRIEFEFDESVYE